MAIKISKEVDREGLIAAIRKAVEGEGGVRLSLRRFAAVSGFRPYHVRRHFATWNVALKGAGFDFKCDNEPLTHAQMLEDWGGVARNLGRMPSCVEYGLRGKHAIRTFERRFQNWSRVPDAFRDFARRAPEWKDVLAMIPSRSARRRKMRGRPPGRRGPKAQRDCRMGDRPVCGPLIDVPGLLHAPTNEMGVVLLFGAMAPSLGFMVESLQARFPDCDAKRLTRLDEWQSVRIEFEYESRNFRDHGHDAEQCDLIVCWAHNWPQCPKNLEVIALSEEIKRLAGTRHAAVVPAPTGGGSPC